MALIALEGVSLDYPVFNSRTRSLQIDLYSRLGGVLAEHDRTLVVRAVDDVSLTLRDGDRIGLVGQNGAGKTTLLRIIAGAFRPTRGTLRIEGSISSYTDLFLGMDGEATGRDNIIFRCVFLGKTFREARVLAPEIAEFSGLGGHLDLPVRTYSAGMLVRLAFSISTAFQPDILVMDEMIGTGDAEFIAKAEQRLNNIVERSKILVISSHDMAIIGRLCTKAAWLDKGRMRLLGKPDEVIAAYRREVESRIEQG